jgi:hypothetical protein
VIAMPRKCFRPERERLLRAARNRDLQARKREKKNRLRCHPLWLTDNEADQIAAGLKPAKGEGDREMTTHQWRTLIGRAGASIIREKLGLKIK